MNDDNLGNYVLQGIIENLDDNGRFLFTAKTIQEDEIWLYIPENLDIEMLIEQGQAKEIIHRFHRDNLIYFVSLLYSIPINSTKVEIESLDDFIPINSSAAQDVVKNYNQYIDYLLVNEVFERNQAFKYLPGSKSSSYRFTENYRYAKPVSIKVTKKTLLKRFLKSKTSDNTYASWLSESVSADISYTSFSKNERTSELDNTFDFILKWWNKLEINQEGALDELNLIHSNNPNALSYIRNSITIDKFKNEDYTFLVDNRSGRIYTLLTSLKKELRNYLSYDKQQLVAIDVKNSQPLLTLALLSEESFMTSGILKYIKQLSSNVKHYTIMLELLNEVQNNLDIIKYKNLILSGTFYESYAEELTRRGFQGNSNEISRSEAKILYYQSVYGHNNGMMEDKQNSGRFIKNRGMEVFNELFPSVTRVFKLIRRGQHNALPISLSALEAELVIYKACKRISEQDSTVPIFTIHDSIVTTSGNEEIVQQTIKEVFADAIGETVELSTEYWGD